MRETLLELCIPNTGVVEDHRIARRVRHPIRVALIFSVVDSVESRPLASIGVLQPIRRSFPNCPADFPCMDPWVRVRVR